MAIYRDPFEEEQKDKPEAEQELGQMKQPQQATAPTAGGQAVGGQAKPTSSGSFTNLSKFLEANKPKVAKLGEKVTTGLAGQAEQAKTGYETAKTGLEQDISKAKVDPTQYKDMGLVDLSKQEGLGTALSGGYAGPTADDIAARTAEERRALERIAGVIQATERQTGLQEALKRSLTPEETRGGYSGAAARLDAALMGRQDAAKQALAGLREKYKGMEQVGASQEQLAQSAQQAREANTAAAEALKNQINKLKNKLKTAILARIDPATTTLIENARRATEEGLMKAFQDEYARQQGELQTSWDPVQQARMEELANLAAQGTSTVFSPQYSDLKFADEQAMLEQIGGLEQFIKETGYEPQLSMADVITPEQQARVDALNAIAMGNIGRGVEGLDVGAKTQFPGSFYEQVDPTAKGGLYEMIRNQLAADRAAREAAARGPTTTLDPSVALPDLPVNLPVNTGDSAATIDPTLPLPELVTK